MTAPSGSPEQDRADYERAQRARKDQGNRVSGLGYDAPDPKPSPCEGPGSGD